MKILHINTTLQGGAGLACRRLNDSLRSIGVDSQTLSLYGDVQDYHVAFLSNSIQRWSYKTKVKIRQKPFKGDSYYPVRTYDGWYDLSNHPLVKAADLIHLHWVANFLDVSKFLTTCRKPVVWTLHDEHPLNGYYHYSEGTDKSKFTRILESQKKHLAEAYKKENLRWIGPSKWMCRQAKSAGLIRSEQVHHIPNPLFGPFAASSSKHGGLNFLFVSAYLNNPAKGFDLALDAFKAFQKEQTEAQLQVIGQGQAVQQEGVQYHGFKSPEEISTFYQSADALLFPSWIDNYPNTVLEAQACGCPVIVLDRGGLPEMIQDGTNGLITTPEELTHALRESLSIDWDRQLISKTVLDLHAPDQIAKKYKAVYQELLS
ncbi:MAG: glycosyltransferase [Bacteroidota bacterium]